MALKKSIISKIHVGKAQLGLDDLTYRSLLQRLTGKTSSKDLSEREAGRVIAYFRENGFIEKSSTKTKGKPHNFKDLPYCIKKVEALLADMKLPWSYADAMAKGMFKIERVAWLKKYEQVEAILVALSNKQEILHYSAIEEDYLIKLDAAEEDKKRLLTVKGKASKRIAYLKSLVEQLGNQVAIRGIE